MTDRNSSQWNIRSPGDDDELDKDTSSFSKRSSNPFYAGDDEYEDEYSDYEDEYEDDEDIADDEDDEDAYGSSYRPYGSSSSTSSSSRYSSGSGSSYTGSSRSGSSSYSSPSGSSYGGSSPAGSTYRSGSSSGSTYGAGRYSSGSYGQEKKDEVKPASKTGESGAGKPSGDKKSSSLFGGRFGNRGAKKPDAKSEKKESKQADPGIGSNLSGRLGALRKRIRSDETSTKSAGAGATPASNRASTTRTLGRFGSRSEKQTKPTSDKKDRKKGKSRFSVSLPFFGRDQDKKSGTKQPTTPKGIGRAKPLPKSSKQPRIKNEGLSLDLKLDLAGWGMIILAGIIFFGALSSTQGNLSRTLLRLIYQLVGVGWFAVPLTLASTGIWLVWRHFGDSVPELDYVKIVGWGVTYLGALATFHFVYLLTSSVYTMDQLQALAEEAAAAGHAGGWLGSTIYMLMMRNIGDAGTFIALVGWWGIGLLIATDLSIAGIVSFLSQVRRATLTRYTLIRANRAEARRSLTASLKPVVESLPDATPAMLEETTGGQKALPAAETLPVSSSNRAQPVIRHRSRDSDEEEPVTVEISQPRVEVPAMAQPVTTAAETATPVAYTSDEPEPVHSGPISLGRGSNPMRLKRPQYTDDYYEDVDEEDYDDYDDYEDDDLLDDEEDGFVITTQKPVSNHYLEEEEEEEAEEGYDEDEEDILVTGADYETDDYEDDEDDEEYSLEAIVYVPPDYQRKPAVNVADAALDTDTADDHDNSLEAGTQTITPTPVVVEDQEQVDEATIDEVAAIADDIEDEEGVNDEFLRPAQPRSAQPKQLRTLRDTGSGLSPAERAALMGDFADSEEDDIEDYDEDFEEDDLDESAEIDETIYEDFDNEAETVEDLPVMELDDEEDEPEALLDEPEDDEFEPQPQPESRPITPAAKETPAVAASSAPQWILPGFRQILEPVTEQNINDDVLLDRARIIEDTLISFGAPGKVVEVNPGPVITQFGVEPDYVESRGGKRTRVKVQAIARLADDLALSLAARSIRIEAPVPGKGFVGIEVPNAETSLVSLRDIMESPEYARLDTKLRIGLGQSVDGTPVAADLTTMPHLLIAGTTGSGKSVCVNAIIACLLLENTPDDLRMIMVDPKRVELTGYNGIPHLVAPVVVELERIVGVLKWVTREMDDRYKKFNERGARNILSYNNMLDKHEKPLPYLVVIIDELADLMMLAPDETERVLTRLAQMSRATGIHLIISTQRPSVDVVTGLIKANFPARVAFAVASSVDSRVILDQPGAERLLGRGDMLFQAPDAAAPARLQGVYVSDTELNRLVNHWKGIKQVEDNTRTTSRLEADLTRGSKDWNSTSSQAGPVRSRTEQYGSPVARSSPGSNFWEQVAPTKEERGRTSSGEADDLYDEAVEVVRRLKKASVSLLQRQLRIGYTRAARLIDVMEENGVVGPAQSGSKPRKVIGYSDDDLDLDQEDMDDIEDDEVIEDEDDLE